MTAQLADKNLARTAPAIRIYQPYLDDVQKALLDEQAIAFDIAFNTAPNSREYELFKALQEREAGASEKDFWGLVSSKFSLKAPIDFHQFRAEAEGAMLAGNDCYVVNPMIGLSALYLNVKEHANLGGHPGMAPLFNMLQSLGCPVDAPQNHAAFFFCNYVVGNERFWSGYFGFCDAILLKLESEAAAGSEAGRAYAGSGNYSRDGGATMRPFLIERLLGYYLQLARSRGLAVAAHRPTSVEFENKFGKRLGGILHTLFETKERFIERGDRNAFQEWLNARTPILREPHLVWAMDDPPRWMQN